MEIAVVNYWAVLLCGVVSMVLGFIWYNQYLFGKIWIETLDITEDELKKGFAPFKTYPLAFLAQLIMAYVLARIMTYADFTTIIEGVRLAFLAWIGFTAMTMLINTLYEHKTLKKLFVDGGYHLIVLLIDGFIIGAF
ncbi:MAG: DUF1761 domain-containing protein [Melioribacteraceae bacterium]